MYRVMQTSKLRTEMFSIIHDEKLLSISIKWEGKTGNPPMLMLPALSTISSSNEWNKFKSIVVSNYYTITLDWPGFGESEKINLRYNGKLLRKTLEKALRIIMSKYNQDLSIVAAGHSAAVVLSLKDRYLKNIKDIVLVAPTWRGPLPSMTGWSPKKLRFINRIIRLPIIGSVIYYLNTTKMVLRFMVKRHVWLKSNENNTERIKILQKISRQKGARYASAAFVTGSLDIIQSSEVWLTSAKKIKEKSTIVIAKDSPKKSLSEMVALSDNCKNILYIRGRLGCHEEFGDEIAKRLFS